MNALEQATELQHQAITLLLNERDKIDQRLAQLGNGEFLQKNTAAALKRLKP
jgi:hypothetical protein